MKDYLKLSEIASYSKSARTSKAPLLPGRIGLNVLSDNIPDLIAFSFLSQIFECPSTELFTAKRQYLKRNVTARLNRFMPIHWNLNPKLKVEVYGVKGKLVKYNKLYLNRVARDSVHSVKFSQISVFMQSNFAKICSNFFFSTLLLSNSCLSL